ncbi:MAG TPA: DUF423 domain-containing protein, partial [Ferruginibacter sp.]|nr:DUF423 domain-containing protein [Ferruginibacter sp.]
KLKQMVDGDTIAVFETAVRYQFYHVFALLAVGILYANFPSSCMRWAGRLFIIGMILFSGSLYFIVYAKYSSLENMKWIGAITPIGGAAFIAGWIFFFFGLSPKDKKVAG